MIFTLFNLYFRTPIGDRIERQAISQLFQSETKNLLVSSTKGHTGHLLAGAGALESMFTVLACHHGRLPSTLNYQNGDEEHFSVKVIESNEKFEWKTSKRFALKNSFGFGGTNSCLVISNLF